MYGKCRSPAKVPLSRGRHSGRASPRSESRNLVITAGRSSRPRFRHRQAMGRTITRNRMIEVTVGSRLSGRIQALAAKRRSAGMTRWEYGPMPPDIMLAPMRVTPQALDGHPRQNQSFALTINLPRSFVCSQTENVGDNIVPLCGSELERRHACMWRGERHQQRGTCHSGSVRKFHKIW